MDPEVKTEPTLPKAEDILAEVIIPALKRKAFEQLPLDVVGKLGEMKIRIDCWFGEHGPQPQDKMKERLLTVEEVAAYLGLKPKTVYNLVAKGIIPCYRVSNRMIRFRIGKIDKWLEKYEIKGRTNTLPVLNDNKSIDGIDGAE